MFIILDPNWTKTLKFSKKRKGKGGGIKIIIWKFPNFFCYIFPEKIDKWWVGRGGVITTEPTTDHTTVGNYSVLSSGLITRQGGVMVHICCNYQNSSEPAEPTPRSHPVKTLTPSFSCLKSVPGSQQIVLINSLYIH